MERGLAADQPGVDARLTIDDVPVKGVLDERAVLAAARPIDAHPIGVVLGEQERSRRPEQGTRVEAIVHGDRGRQLQIRVVGQQAGERFAA